MAFSAHVPQLLGVAVVTLALAFPAVAQTADEQQLLAVLAKQPSDVPTLIALAKLYATEDKRDDAERMTARAETAIRDLAAAIGPNTSPATTEEIQLIRGLRARVQGGGGVPAMLDLAQVLYNQRRLIVAQSSLAEAADSLRVEGAGLGGPRLVRVGGTISEPRRIHNVNPKYPPEAQQRKISGLVIIDLVITTEGTVRNPNLLRSADPLLDQAALEAVRQWRYTPTRLNGELVEVKMTVTVNFTLN